MSISKVFKYAVAVGAGFEVGRSIKTVCAIITLKIVKKALPDTYEKAKESAFNKEKGEK